MIQKTIVKIIWLKPGSKVLRWFEWKECWIYEG